MEMAWLLSWAWSRACWLVDREQPTWRQSVSIQAHVSVRVQLSQVRVLKQTKRGKGGGGARHPGR